MKRSMKIMFQNSPKHIRKAIVQAMKHPQPRIVMDRAIAKPQMVKQLDGKVVPYVWS